MGEPISAVVTIHAMLAMGPWLRTYGGSLCLFVCLCPGLPPSPSSLLAKLTGTVSFFSCPASPGQHMLMCECQRYMRLHIASEVY